MLSQIHQAKATSCQVMYWHRRIFGWLVKQPAARPGPLLRLLSTIIPVGLALLLCKGCVSLDRPLASDRWQLILEANLSIGFDRGGR